MTPNQITVIEDLTPLQLPPKPPHVSQGQLDREAAQREWAAREAARAEATAKRGAEASAERQAREQKQAKAQREVQRAWAEKRSSLQAELAVAEEVLRQCRVDVDLSSPEAALESAKGTLLSIACQQLVEGAEERLGAHSAGQGRRGMFAA
jgi:hypothetical protein